MQACSVKHGVAVVAGDRAGMVVETAIGLQTVWFAPPPRALRRGRLGRGFWLQVRAHAWSWALRSGRQCPSPTQRLAAHVAVAWEATSTLALGAVVWLVADALPLASAWLPALVAVARLGLGRRGRARRRWHALEHRVLDELQPSNCGATALIAGTLLAAVASTLSLASGLPQPLVAALDLATFAAAMAWAPARRFGHGEPARAADEAWARPRLPALRSLLATLQASSAPSLALGPGAAVAAVTAGVASDLGAVYTVAPEGRETAGAT